jgi:hypothetical protein
VYCVRLHTPLIKPPGLPHAPVPPGVAASTVTGMAEPTRAPDMDTGPVLNCVELLVDGEGLALIIYGPGPDYCVHDVAFVPVDELDADGR